MIYVVYAHQVTLTGTMQTSPPLFPLPTSTTSRDHSEVISTETTCLGPTRSGLARARSMWVGEAPVSVGGMSGYREHGQRQKTRDRHVSNIGQRGYRRYNLCRHVSLMSTSSKTSLFSSLPLPLTLSLSLSLSLSVSVTL